MLAEGSATLVSAALHSFKHADWNWLRYGRVGQRCGLSYARLDKGWRQPRKPDCAARQGHERNVDRAKELDFEGQIDRSELMTARVIYNIGTHVVERLEGDEVFGCVPVRGTDRQGRSRRKTCGTISVATLPYRISVSSAAPTPPY